MNRRQLVTLLGFFSLGVAIWTWRHSGPQAVRPAPVQTAPTSASSQPNLTVAATDSKVVLLDEILASRNDNDSRLDTEFASLSERTKTLLREKYLNLPRDKYNQRGTIILVLGKNLSNADDIHFLGFVADERPDTLTPDQQRHDAYVTELTLAYPQVVALKKLSDFSLKATVDLQLVEIAKSILEKAASSPYSIIARTASSLR